MALDIKARKPEWLKVRPPSGDRYRWIKEHRKERHLSTVCEEAHCPNVGECWTKGTATFMVMGSICTRACRFCAVDTMKHPPALDPEEPANLARTVADMQLNYIVLTSVDRDDLPDQGAQHFADCVAAVKQASPSTRVEILFPDFRGEQELIATCVTSGAEVLAHNIETVRRLTPSVRDRRCDYDQSLGVLATVKEVDPDAFSKSSIMVGVGETEAEVVQAMRDLRGVGVDFLTLGQYMRPGARHMAIEEYVPPEQFARYEQIGGELGFLYVASGPLVRSSYRAGEYFIHNLLTARERGERFAPSRLEVIS